MKKALLSLALCFLGMGAMAQTLTGHDSAAEPAEGGLYYIYNVKARKYLNTGYGNYNTQLGFDESGMIVKVVKSKNGTDYGLMSVELGDKYWGWSKYYDRTDEFVDPFSPTEFSDKGSGSYYCDQGKDACENLVFTASAAVENGYIISLRDAWGATPHFTYSEEHKSTMHILNEADITEGYDVWQFIPAGISSDLQSCPVMFGGQYNIYNVLQGKYLKGGEATKAGGNDFQFADKKSDAWKIPKIRNYHPIHD